MIFRNVSEAVIIYQSVLSYLNIGLWNDIYFLIKYYQVFKINLHMQ